MTERPEIKFRDHRELLRGSTHYSPEQPTACGSAHPPEQPNKELMIVKTIQGCLTVVCNSLYKLDRMALTMYKTQDIEHRKLIAKAIEDIDFFEKTTLFELQKAFEC